jgi:adenylate cyclase
MNGSLVAVLAADVAGYSKLMSDDAKSTLVALKRLRTEIFGPVVASRRGRVVKNMGDGWIVLFGAATDAAACALQIQELMANNLSQSVPEIRLRLGVHLGDVVEDEYDIYGDGVNIASRLEQLAEPGSIVISDPVFGILDGTLKPSFDDALTGDLVTYPNSTHWLSVTTGDNVDGAYSLTGRIRTHCRRFRLEVKLVGPSGEELWSDKFDGHLDDAFDWQDTACEALVAYVLTATFDTERRKLEKLTIDQMTAKECELYGQLAIDRLDPEAFALALKYSNAAFEKDQSAAHALALALVAYLSAAVMGYDEVNLPYKASIHAWCRAAAPLAADHALLNLDLGATTYAQSNDPTALRIPVEQALRQSPTDFITLTLSGWAYIWIGDYRTALDCLVKARKLGGQSPWALSIQGGLALASLLSGDDDAAIRFAEQGLTVAVSYSTLHRVLAAAHAHQGRFVAAQQSVEAAQALNPNDSIAKINSRNMFRETIGANRYLDGLRQAGMPE